jgi:hypothetical protein
MYMIIRAVHVEWIGMWATNTKILWEDLKKGTTWESRAYQMDLRETEANSVDCIQRVQYIAKWRNLRSEWRTRNVFTSSITVISSKCTFPRSFFCKLTRTITYKEINFDDGYSSSISSYFKEIQSVNDKLCPNFCATNFLISGWVWETAYSTYKNG